MKFEHTLVHNLSWKLKICVTFLKMNKNFAKQGKESTYYSTVAQDVQFWTPFQLLYMYRGQKILLLLLLSTCNAMENNGNNNNNNNNGNGNNNGNNNRPVCPNSAQTRSIVEEYQENNGQFLNDFRDVLNKMLVNGYDTSGGCFSGDPCPFPGAFTSISRRGPDTAPGHHWDDYWV